MVDNVLELHGVYHKGYFSYWFSRQCSDARRSLFSHSIHCFLSHSSDAKELEYWVDKINYVAGLLSAPSLPSAVSSDRGFHRPILPAGVTHLSVVSRAPSSPLFLLLLAIMYHETWMFRLPSCLSYESCGKVTLLILSVPKAPRMRQFDVLVYESVDVVSYQ